MIINETWVHIPEYVGLYQVSDLGNVKSLKWGKERILKPSLSMGYLHVKLCKDGIQKIHKVHRLVYEAFFGKTDLHIDHIIEGNKLDNRLCNLQAITNRQNTSKYMLSSKKTSRYVGVNWNSQKNKWRSEILINGKRKHLGLFDNELDAHNKYQESLKEIENL